MHTDTTLIDASLNGDLSAQRGLFQRHRGTLRAALARCGFDGADVSELEQRVWLRLLGPRRALASYNGAGTFAGWLRTIAFNEARSELRRRRRRGTPEDIERAASLICETSSPERSAIKNEKRALLGDALRDVLDELDADDRTLLLAWSQGTTALSLAQERGVHRSSMSRRLDKLRKTVGARLRTTLWEHYGRASSELSISHVDLARAAVPDHDCGVS